MTKETRFAAEFDDPVLSRYYSGFVPVLTEDGWRAYMRDMKASLRDASPRACDHFASFMQSVDQFITSPLERKWARRYAQGYVFGLRKVEVGSSKLTQEEVRDWSVEAFRRVCRLLALREDELLGVLVDDLMQALSNEGRAIKRGTVLRLPAYRYMIVSTPVFAIFRRFRNWKINEGLLLPGDNGSIFAEVRRRGSEISAPFVLFRAQNIDASCISEPFSQEID